jgi:hypothetical protein
MRTGRAKIERNYHPAVQQSFGLDPVPHPRRQFLQPGLPLADAAAPPKAAPHSTRKNQRSQWLRTWCAAKMHTEAHQCPANGLAVYALDLRGRGKSEGERFYVEKIEDYAEWQPALLRDGRLDRQDAEAL